MDTFRNRRCSGELTHGTRKRCNIGGLTNVFAYLIAEEPIMNNVDAKKRPAPPSPEDDDDDSPVDDFEESESEANDDLSETGIDLTDASELDADNVPADEEFARVMNAPD